MKDPALVAPAAVATLAFVVPVLAAAGASAVNTSVVWEPGTALPADPAFAAEHTVAEVFVAADIAEPGVGIAGRPAEYLAD